MHWRSIGPTRAGRARALAGVPSQPNVFYIGFDNGGVWRSTDYGSTWVPLFDNQPTGSIGAIAVAPVEPQHHLCGHRRRHHPARSCGGRRRVQIHRRGQDLDAPGPARFADDRQYRCRPQESRTGCSWRRSGHPYGPNPERGIFRSTDGGAHFDKVLYNDEYTSGNDVRIDPQNPNIVYAALWQQQQGFMENGAFGGTDGGIYKSTDGGNNWRKLTLGLPPIIQANLAIAPSNPRIHLRHGGRRCAARRAPAPRRRAAGGGGGGAEARRRRGIASTNRPTAASTGSWPPTIRASPRSARSAIRRTPGRWSASAAATCPPSRSTRKNENVVYSCSTVFWRTEDGGLTWSAVRGAPGGDDYQKSWVNPDNPNIILLVSDQGGVVSANRGESWSNWYTQPTAAMYHVTADNAFPYRLCSGQQDSGSACVDSRSMDGEITFHDWHPVGIEEYGEAAPDPKNPDLVYGGKVSRSITA